MFGSRHDDAGTTRYQMRQKIVAIGDDYWIEDDRGERVFKVDSKALRLRKTLVFEDVSGAELLKIEERRFRIRDTMEIEDRDGRTVATVRKALISPFHDRWSVDLTNGPSLDIKGDIIGHEYEIEADGQQVAAVSKKWFRLTDTYGVEVGPGQDPVLILAIAAVLDTTAPEPE